MTTLKQLRYFESLARHRHFGRAAQECFITQPALSQQIQDFEAAVGCQLVERRKSSIAVTELGREIARRAGEILAAVSDLNDYARHHANLLSGPLKLGVIPSIGPYLLPAVLPELKRRFPKLQLRVRESHTSNLIASLREGRIDVALLALPAAAPGLEEIALFEDPFYLLVPANHRLAGKNAIRMSELSGEKLLLLEEGHCLRDQTLDLCKNIGIESSSEFGATSLATIIQLVKNSYGVTVLPEMSLAIEARAHSNVHVARFEKPEPVRRIGLIWRETSPRKVDFVELGRLISRTSRKTAEAA